MKKKITIALIVVIVVVILIVTLLILNKKEEKEIAGVEIGLKEKISSNIADYGDFSDEENCQIDINDIDNTKLGTYKYYIKCKKTIYTGSIIVKDKIYPQAKLIALTRPINATIEAREFVEECIDETICQIYYFNEYELREKVKKAGSYEIEIRLMDESRNVSKVFGKLTITNEKVNQYLTCEMKESSDNIKDVSINEKIIIGLDDNNYNYVSYRDLIYSFNEHDFNNYIKNINDDTEEFDNHYGEIIVNKEDQTISIRTLIFQSQLKQYVKIINRDNLLNYYQNKEYKCY